MKKTLFTLLLCFSALFLGAQEDTTFLNNKTFIANVGSICEETSEPNPCAGQQVYLVLKFKENTVSVIEKYISSCDEESTMPIGNYNWDLLDSNAIKIYYNPEEIAYTYLENLTLTVNNKQLLGKRTTWNNHITEYIFTEDTPKKSN